MQQHKQPQIGDAVDTVIEEAISAGGWTVQQMVNRFKAQYKDLYWQKAERLADGGLGLDKRFRSHVRNWSTPLANTTGSSGTTTRYGAAVPHLNTPGVMEWAIPSTSEIDALISQATAGGSNTPV